MTNTLDQLMLDIFTTALEGGIGYWSQAISYHWCDADGVEDFKGFHAEVVDDEDTQHDITRSVIAKGYRLAATEWRDLGWSTEPPTPVVLVDTDWDFDAGDADLIVQLGLFGEIIYG